MSRKQKKKQRQKLFHYYPGNRTVMIMKSMFERLRLQCLVTFAFWCWILFTYLLHYNSA